MRAGRRAVLLAILGALSFTAPMRAHDEAPKPMVVLTIAPQGSALRVSAHIPVVALMDANLPRTEDRAIDTAVIAGPLQLVARDLATTLAFTQDGQPLPFPTTTASLADDRTAVDVTLGYVIQAGDAPLSARLRTFRSMPDPVAVRATFTAASGESREFIVAGAPELIVFNPTLAQTLRQFATRGARSVADGWSALLFLLTLTLAAGTGASWRQLRALLAAEAVGAVLTAVVPLPPLASAGATGLAASVVVIAALIGMAQTGLRWMTPLAAAFGLCNGVAIGLAFGLNVSRAGAHPTAGLLAFILTIGLAQAWLLVLFTTARDMAARAGLPIRATALAALVYACHSALHLLGNDATTFSTQTTWTVEHLLAVLALAWVVLSAIAVLATGTRGRSGMASA